MKDREKNRTRPNSKDEFPGHIIISRIEDEPRMSTRNPSGVLYLYNIKRRAETLTDTDSISEVGDSDWCDME